VAALDQILDSLLRHRMESLRLEPGQVPRLHRDGQDYRADKTPLQAGQIHVLLSAVAPPRVNLTAAHWGFDYVHAGTRFRFDGGGGAGGPWAVAHPVPGAAVVAVKPSEPAAPEPAATESAPPEPTAAAAAPTAPSAPPPARPGAAREIRHIRPLLLELLQRQGSDLHLSSGQAPRIRVDGELVPLRGYYPPDAERLQEVLLAIAPPPNREQFLARSDTDFGFEIPHRGRFRANLFRDRLGIGAVFRLIPVEVPSFDDLGLPPVLREMVHLSRGLVLVTGPTGSGKSTTLAAVLDLVNRSRADHVITIEDPVEFVHPSKRCLVHQREVGSHTESFATALRAALREDPDVVLVGELRDLETVAIAVKTAETGHLVFGTLHTTSAASTVERLIDQFPEGQQAQIRLMLSSSLKAVVSQVLLRRVDGGRVAAFEILRVNGAVANLIREGKAFQIPSVLQTGRGEGMQRLDDHLLELVANGVVAAREAYVKANDKKDFAARLRAADADLSFLDGDGEPAAPQRRLQQVG